MTVVDSAVQMLNDFLALDPEAMHKLMSLRVPVNQALAEHPMIHVGETVTPVTDECVLRPLSLINSLLIANTGADDWGFIYLDTDTDGYPLKFHVWKLGE